MTVASRSTHCIRLPIHRPFVCPVRACPYLENEKLKAQNIIITIICRWNAVVLAEICVQCALCLATCHWLNEILQYDVRRPVYITPPRLPSRVAIYRP